MGYNKHHGGADGAILGGIAGKLHGKGHTGRDTVVGGGIGHILEKHHDHKGKTHSHGPSTSTASSSSKFNASGHNPHIGDKLSGKIQVAVGKLTHSPNLVLEGEIKQTHGSSVINQLKSHR